MFGIDGFRTLSLVKMEGLLRFGTVRKIFFRFFCSRTTAFSVRKVSILPASHLLLTQHCQKVVCLAIQSNAADDIAPGAEPREW